MTTYVRHTILYVKNLKETHDSVYDMNLRCRMYNTYDIVCVSGLTISYTMYIPCDMRYRMYIIRCRRSTYDFKKTNNIAPTMSYLQCRKFVPEYCTYGIV